MKNHYNHLLSNRWSCNHKAQFVEVGNKKVYLCGRNDLDSQSFKQIAKLDVFIALDDTWEKYIKLPNTQNTLVKRLIEKFCTNTLSNLFVIEVPDRTTNDSLAQEVIRIFEQNYNIGFGCIGGHGRTGWLLGKLIQKVEGLHGDALLYAVRSRWCEEAIESKEQFVSLGINYANHRKSISLLYDIDDMSDILDQT